MADIKKTEEMLMTAIFEVFEKMYYIFVEPLKGGGGDFQMYSMIDFNGPSKGTMQLAVSRDIAETMVRNMLNADDDNITETLMADCVKESINMVCGNFVRKLDPEKVFHLSIPTFGMGNRASLRNAEENNLSLTFTSEGGYIEVSIRCTDAM